MLRNDAQYDKESSMRILLKLSGEVLGGKAGVGLDAEALQHFAQVIAGIQAAGHQVGIVTGGGNILRGKATSGLDRAKADQIGMQATVINAMALEQTLIQYGVKAVAMSVIPSLARPYQIIEARELLQSGHVVMVAGGTSNPYFTTDSAAALRALELKADILLKATKVDGVYDKDPKKHADAQRYESLSYNEVLEKQLAVMDLTAIVLCQENGLVLRVCNVEDLADIDQVLTHTKLSTLVHA